MTVPTALVTSAVAAGSRYGFEIMEATGLPSGTVYPVLRRLERGGFLVSTWEDPAVALADGRPRRRMYKLTGQAAPLISAAAGKLMSLRGFAGPGLVSPEAG